MATKSTDTTKTAAPETATASTTEGIAGLGRNLNLDKAKRLFGAENAVAAMDAVAKAGGYGAFTEDDYKNPLFGGFAIPDPETVKADEEKSKSYAAIRGRIESALGKFK